MTSNQFYSLKGSMTFAYEGDRNRDDIVAFAKRLLGKFAVIYMGKDYISFTLERSQQWFIILPSMFMK